MPDESRSVLLVEDDLPSAYLVRYLLESAGFSVETAHDGMSGVEAALANRPDFVLMDIMLPGMSGLDATKRLREEYGTDLPIIALTAYAMRGDREMAMEAGCTGFITKPIDPSTFVDEVRACI